MSGVTFNETVIVLIFRFCSTLIMRGEVIPSPVTVIVPSRLPSPVFSDTEMVNVPFSVPFVGETLNHESEELTAVQFTLDVTFTVLESASLSNSRDEVRMTNSGLGFCVTLIVSDVTPVPLTVIVAVRSVVLSFFAAVTVISLSLLPEVGEIDSHEFWPLIVQFVLELIINFCSSPEAIKLSEDSDTFSSGVGVHPSEIVPKSFQTLAA